MRLLCKKRFTRARVLVGSHQLPDANQPTNTMEDLKAIVALIVLIAVLIAGIWMDNYLPGFNPVETRMHP